LPDHPKTLENLIQNLNARSFNVLIVDSAVEVVDRHGEQESVATTARFAAF
jgi:hypothetical protein